VRPERRRRADLVAAVVIVVLVVAGATVLWRTSPIAGTTDSTAATPIAAPPAASGVPAAFTEAWLAPSAATASPVVAGPAAVTADGGAVVGHDALTGAERWRYSRDVPLCTAAAGFPSADDGAGRLLALYEGSTGWCSELTALRSATGARAAASNPDMRTGTRLLADGSFVAATGPDYLEVWRSDLVRTLEFGAVPTPVQVAVQPRTGCLYGSAALMAGRLGVIERCPGETADRITVVKPDGAEAEKPEVQLSVELPGTGATVVALSAERVAVALPDPARLMVLDKAGEQVAMIALDVPDEDVATETLGSSPGGPAAVTTDGERVYWWTGAHTVALDADLGPVWTAPGTLGPAVAYGGGLLVPVAGGLAELDPRRGTVLRTVAVQRTDRDGPVRLAVIGEMLLEQRGPEVVALRPGP
jgi:hypothetical protein